jgi:hypothetical protein
MVVKPKWARQKRQAKPNLKKTQLRKTNGREMKMHILNRPAWGTRRPIIILVTHKGCLQSEIPQKTGILGKGLSLV